MVDLFGRNRIYLGDLKELLSVLSHKIICVAYCIARPKLANRLVNARSIHSLRDLLKAV